MSQCTVSRAQAERVIVVATSKARFVSRTASLPKSSHTVFPLIAEHFVGGSLQGARGLLDILRTSPDGSRVCSCLRRLRGVQYGEVKGVTARPSTPGRMRSPAPVVPASVGVIPTPPSVSLPVLPTNLSPSARTDTDRCPLAPPCLRKRACRTVPGLVGVRAQATHAIFGGRQSRAPLPPAQPP